MDELEALFKSYFSMSDGAKVTCQKTMLLRLMDVMDEMNDAFEEPYELEEILQMAEDRYIMKQQYELAGIVRDIRSRMDLDGEA